MTLVSAPTLLLTVSHPHTSLFSYIAECRRAGFTKIVLLDTSTAGRNARTWDCVRGSGCVVLHPPYGEDGPPLRAALRYCAQHDPQALGVVTSDAGDCIPPADLFRCANQMRQTQTIVLGIRNFSEQKMPRLHLLGSKFICFMLRVGCGMKLDDPKTPLRAIPAKTIPYFTCGKRCGAYLYETRILLQIAKNRLPYEPCSVSYPLHPKAALPRLHPLLDLLLIGLQIFKFSVSSLFCTGVEWLLNYCFLWLLAHTQIPYSRHILLAGTVARLFSSILNLFVNAKVVFSADRDTGKTILRYYALCIPQTAVTLCLTKLLSGTLFGVASPAVNTFFLALSSVLLFFLSYRIQKHWVFQSQKKTC